jgi:hypothetical protein
MDNSITNIRLVDCNSNFSEEKLGGNNEPLSIFTNKIGHGLNIEPGDKISLYSAFISELGAGGEASIEITDEYLETKTKTISQITYNSPINGCNDKILGYESASIRNVDYTYDVTGNKTTIFFNFYKTNNGENCYFLPRRFVYFDADHDILSWVRDDEPLYGRPFHQSCPDPDDDNIGGLENVFVADADYFRFQQPDATATSASNVYKCKTDNHNFTIFGQSDVYYGEQSDTTIPPTDFSSPASRKWYEILEPLEITLDTGFQSPSSISDSITRQFRKQSQPEQLEARSLAYKDATTDIQRFIPISTKIDSPFYKTFYATNQSNNIGDTYNAWRTWAGASQENLALKWLSSQQFIGIKRPELYKKTYALAEHMMQLRGFTGDPARGVASFTQSLNIADFERGNPANEHIIKTNLEWNRTTLEFIRDVFLEQANHPELFTNKLNYYFGFTRVDNSRFLHMNTRRTSADYYAGYQLGDDNIFVDDAINRISCPFFIDYNTAYATTYTDGNSWESGYCFGFALKHIDAGTEYIAFTTRRLGFVEDTTLPSTLPTLPERLFRRNASAGATLGTQINQSTYWGSDIHFNAFGNVMLGLTTGQSHGYFNETQYGECISTLYKDSNASTQPNPEIRSANIVSEIYLGADQPVCSYNTTTNRFELAQLHTPEFVQNKYNAGGVHSTNTGTDYVELSATAGDRVYKINKRLNSGNFTPDMRNYNFNNSKDVEVYTSVGKSASALFDVENLNPNISQWTVFDSLCGIVIKDFGVSLSNWNNGIWGILGFSYEQFNATRTSENDITTRVGNDNKNALPYAFTNADVGSNNTINFITNNFGAGMYNLSMPLTLSFHTDKPTVNKIDDVTPLGFYKQVFPAITQPQSSVILSAPNLPRKLKNGYFLIRSNILEESAYNGGFESSALYPVIGVVRKEDTTGDFFTEVDSSLEFTFTKPTTVTSITTSIHDPSQQLSRLNVGSAVIYKITKSRPYTYDIVNQIMNQKK